ncbi:MAG: translation elongation factor Ts [Candidatus Azosocius agrarius]|nr:MAG: translation elongation factor Ts [Gammaproteobacteria bacterium]
MKDITGEDIKILRNCTGAGIMDCKKALIFSNGDIDKAIEELKKKGIILAEKKSCRKTNEGLINILISENKRKCLIIEVNCETDFVAKKIEFKNYVFSLSDYILKNDIYNIEDFNNLCPKFLENEKINLISRLGENICVKKINCIINENGYSVGFYMHYINEISKIGAIVLLNGYNDELAHDLAMQVVALNPDYISDCDIPASKLEYEKNILLFKAEELYKNKSKTVVHKIVEGQLEKFVNDMTLYGQFFIKDNKKLVKDILSLYNLKVLNMVRFEIGLQ